MENEEKIRLEARRRLEEQLKQYRVQRHKERVSEWNSCRAMDSTNSFKLFFYLPPTSSCFSCFVVNARYSVFNCASSLWKTCTQVKLAAKHSIFLEKVTPKINSERYGAFRGNLKVWLQIPLYLCICSLEFLSLLFLMWFLYTVCFKIGSLVSRCLIA